MSLKNCPHFFYYALTYFFHLHIFLLFAGVISILWAMSTYEKISVMSLETQFHHVLTDLIVALHLWGQCCSTLSVLSMILIKELRKHSKTKRPVSKIASVLYGLMGKTSTGKRKLLPSSFSPTYHCEFMWHLVKQEIFSSPASRLILLHFHNSLLLYFCAFFPYYFIGVGQGLKKTCFGGLIWLLIFHQTCLEH